MHIQRGVRHGHVHIPKSGHGRTVPISPVLARLLADWRERTKRVGLVFSPPHRRKAFDPRELREEWRAALRKVGLQPMRFYEATRHTFASHWVMDGHPIERLSKILGHSSVMVTEIYAHLKPSSLAMPDVVSLEPTVTSTVDDPTGGR